MKNKRIFLLCCFLSLSTLLYAQESTVEAEEQIEGQTEEQLAEGTDDGTEQVAVEASPLTRRLEMEIRTSTLSELAAWCRSLGLSEGGTRAELAERIRNHLELPTPQGADEASRKTITIESSQSSEYFTIDVIDEDYARLRGDVRIKLKDGDAVHTITAGEILFNRTRNILTARGGVVYEKVEADKTETFRGENITVNIDNWSSTFLDGSTIHSDSGETAYLFSGAVISRSDEEVTILSNAQVSNANSDEPYWSITASRIWLLPGSDFAILNAVLKVGEIPVLYIPFLYYPTDEMIFHPVIGYRSREGGFVQTTTYILGQPKADEGQSNSINSIFGGTTDGEKERQGIFLRSTGKKRINQDEVSLRAMFDYYVNLGTYLGLELNTPKIKILNPLGLTLGIGFTRTISPDTGYNPFAPNYDGTFEQNHSNFFSTPVPFRYQMNFKSSLSGKNGSFGWDLSYYSDPFVGFDFNSRTESMDYINMIQQGSLTDEERPTTQSQISENATPKWELNGSLTPPLQNLPSYVPRISIPSISSALTFKSITDVSVNAYAPEKLFFAPDKLKIYSISGTIFGTPLSIGNAQSQTNTGADAEQSPQDPLGDIGSPISPWIIDDSVQTITVPDILTPPALTQTFNLPGAGNTKVSIDYRLTPTSSSELQFMSRNWQTYNDVDWNEVESILTTFRGGGDLNIHIDHSTGLFTNLITLSGNGVWQEYTYLNEEMYTDLNTGNVDEDKMEDKRRTQYSQTNYATSYTYNGALRPFYADPVFAQTNFQYNFRGTLVKSRKFTDGNGPELTPVWGSWVRENIDENIFGLNGHSLTANFAAKIMDKDQNITVSANLPPLNGLITTNSTFRVWISETNVRFNILEEPKDSGTWEFQPFYITETLNIAKPITFTYYMEIKPEENNEITTIKSTLLLWDFRTEFTAIREVPSVFVPKDPLNPSLGGTWVKQGEKDLIPYSLILSYIRTFPSTGILNNRAGLSFYLNTSLNFNLQQPTDSKFQFTISLDLNVTKFCTLKLSASSNNSVIWRYFKGVQGMEDSTSMYAEGEQNNLFIDLFDSFNFFDESKRRRSGFKMQRFGLELIHLLGDWTAEFKINIYPYGPPGQKIEITNDISFTIKWTPISEIKSEINYRGDTNRWQIE